MDISKLITTDTAACTITDPTTGKDTDIKITLYGMDSAKFREVSLKASKRDSKEETVNDLVELTAGWEGVEMGGKTLDFTPANAKKVYKMSAPIRKQVDRFIVVQANFLPKA